MARLIISAPDRKKGILELTKPLTTLGRGNANDLVLNDPGISRFHAVIQLKDHKISIADRGSTNGILINGRRIGRESALHPGDVVRLGGYELRVENGDENSIRVRQSEWPSALNQIMRVRTGPSPRREAEPAGDRMDELARRMKKLERENYLLTVLYDFGRALNAQLSVEDISEQVVSLAFRIEGVERGFVMLFDESGQVGRQSEVRYRRPQSSDDHPKIILSRSVMERLRTEQQPILIDDVCADERFRSSESLRVSGIRSAMCAPLMGSGRLFGILYADNMEKALAFTQDELNVFALLATQAGAAIDNVLAHAKIAEQTLQRSALERFLSPEVAAMVVANPDIRLGGVNQKVTVMFADIRGFTPMSENLEPGRVVEILNEYFTRVTEVIFDCGGMLDKYIGDAVMAVFGAPISKGRDAANAVHAAIQIQRLLIELNRDAVARQWPELRVGIGINTGIATAGNIGSPQRLEYTVVGDTVNTASRLMSNAAGGQILVAHSTAAETNGAFDLVELPPLQVKGRIEPVHVFRVSWEDDKEIGRSGDRIIG
jgi:adenylate cyclase